MTSEEILSEYAQGIYSQGDALSRLADIAAESGVEATLCTLPDAWRIALEQWIFDTYDNNVEPDQFLFFGDPAPDLEQHRKHTTNLREWIRKTKNRRGQNL